MAMARTPLPLVGVMAKAPRAGHAKTRLTQAFPPEVAADFYLHFLCDTVDSVRRIDSAETILVCPAGDGPDLCRLGLGLPIIEQVEPGLMQGLAFGIAHGLSAGHPAVVLVNGDSPTLPPACIVEALAALDRHDVVLGPTADGGYYAIAATVPCDRLLCDAPYPDGATICRDTLDRARQLGLRGGVVSPWFDIDLPLELGQLALLLADAPSEVARHTRRALVTYRDLVAPLIVGRG